MYLNDVYTLPASLAGIPGLSVPSGTNKAGLPIGLQLLAPALEEARLFALAATIERHVPPMVPPMARS
jgi:aspartyl-tRNA(Asn)/glutamyl-tRNA(Gln) amidotransferase subunit A